jgi:hypothetical protein
VKGLINLLLAKNQLLIKNSFFCKVGLKSEKSPAPLPKAEDLLLRGKHVIKRK